MQRLGQWVIKMFFTTSVRTTERKLILESRYIFSIQRLRGLLGLFNVGSYQIHSKQLIFIYPWNKEKLVPSSQDNFWTVYSIVTLNIGWVAILLAVPTNRQSLLYCKRYLYTRTHVLTWKMVEKKRTHTHTKQSSTRTKDAENSGIAHVTSLYI